jgi:hypothetical protein
MILIKLIGYIILTIIILILLAFLACMIQSFYITFLLKKKNFKYKNENTENRK